jgi:hypothetical protein
MINDNFVKLPKGCIFCGKETDNITLPLLLWLSDYMPMVEGIVLRS